MAEDALFLTIDIDKVLNRLFVVFHTSIDWHGNRFCAPIKSNFVVRVEPQNFIGRGKRIRIVLLLEEARHNVLQRLYLVLSDPLVLLGGLSLPFLLGQLRVIDTFRVPLRVVAFEIAPDAVGLFVLAAGRARIATVVLLVGRFHD